jgi:hypothetical protein
MLTAMYGYSIPSGIMFEPVGWVEIQTMLAGPLIWMGPAIYVTGEFGNGRFNPSV